MSENPSPKRLLLAVTLVLASLPAAAAEIPVRVKTPAGQPVAELVLLQAGGDLSAPPTDATGRTGLPLPEDAEVGSWVEFSIKPTAGEGESWILLSPWNGLLPITSVPGTERLKVPVPDTDIRERAAVEMTAGRAGDDSLLESQVALQAIAANLVAHFDRSLPARGALPPAERDHLLAAEAARIGLEPGEVDAALRAWKPASKEVFSRGLAALCDERYEQAVELLKKLWQRTFQASSTDPAAAVDTAFFLAHGLFQQERFEGAAETLRGAVALRPKDPQLLVALGRALHRAGDFQAAEETLSRALVIQESHLGPDHPELARTLENLAVARHQLGSHEQAEQAVRRALAIDEAVLGPSHIYVAGDLNLLAAVRVALGDFSGAEPLLERVLEIREASLGPEHAEVAAALSNLGVVKFETGRIVAARQLFERALAIDEKALGPNDPMVATDLTKLALLLDRQGRQQEAEEAYRRAVEILDPGTGTPHPDLAMSLANIAYFLHRSGRWEEAEPLYQRAVKILEASSDSDQLLLATTLRHLGMLYQKQERLVEAEPLYRRALSLFDEVNPEDPEIVPTLWSLSDLLRCTDRKAEAEELEARARAIRSQTD